MAIVKVNIKEFGIEIGAGLGIFRHLNIPMTDSKMQEDPEIAAYYKLFGQPVIQYPNDIEKLDYKDAINKYKPNTVIGSYITQQTDNQFTDSFGAINETEIINQGIRYINIGNLDTHASKSIFNIPHITLTKEWIITRDRTEEKRGYIKIWN